MELRKRKIETPLYIFIAVTFFILQVWAVTGHYQTSTQQPSTSVNSPSRLPTSLARSRFLKWRGLIRRRHGAARTRREFLFAHNMVRRRVGEPPFEWDGRLAAYARAWANQRVGDCRLVHSNGPYGENLFWGSENWRPRDVVKAWADEDKYYDVKANTCEPQHMCGHYTQIVWRDSNKVGCARVNCLSGGFYSVCVYNPPGNYEGENPFGHYSHNQGQNGLLRDDPPAAVVSLLH